MQAVGTTAVFDTAYVPVAVLAPDVPVTFGDQFANYRANAVERTYSGGEPVYDPLTCSFPIDPNTCQPLTYAGGEPVRDVFTGALVLDPYNISIDVPASVGASFALGGAGLGTVAIDTGYSPIALPGGATRYRISGNFAGAGAVTATAGATTVTLGDVVTSRAFIHQEPLRHQAGDPMLHIAGEPVVALRGEIARYLGGEKTFDENGEQVFNGSQPFLHTGGQAVIHDRRERAFDLVDATGAIVPLLDADAPYAPLSFAYDPAAPLTSLDVGSVRNLRAASGSTPADRAFVTVYDGTLIYNLTPSQYTLDFANDEIDLAARPAVRRPRRDAEGHDRRARRSTPPATRCCASATSRSPSASRSSTPAATSSTTRPARSRCTPPRRSRRQARGVHRSGPTRSASTRSRSSSSRAPTSARSPCCFDGVALAPSAVHADDGHDDRLAARRDAVVDDRRERRRPGARLAHASRPTS